MIALLRFLASNAWLICLLAVLGAIRYGWKAAAIYRTRRITPYALERESAEGQMKGAWTRAVVLAGLGLGALLAGPLVLERTADPALISPTPAAGILTRTPMPMTFAPTPTPPALTATPPPQASPELPTPTVPPPPAAPTPTATAAPAPAPPDCPDPGAQLSAPVAGQLLSGAVQVEGTADIPGFDFYKFEINGLFTGGEWRTIGEVWRTPVRGGVLGVWDASPIVQAAPGLYFFRLVVVDRTGNSPPPCVIQVRIASE